MGLDMYLYTIVSQDNLEKLEIFCCENVASLFMCFTFIEANQYKDLYYFKLIYWRNTNSIHKWLKEECGKIITYDNLRELYDITCKVYDNYEKGNKDICKELLPPCKKAYFGTFEIDEEY